MHIVDVERKNDTHIIKHPFFTSYYFQQKFLSVVQLCKIFSVSKMHKVSLDKLFERLKISAIKDQALKEQLDEHLGKMTDVFTHPDNLLSAISNAAEKITQKRDLILRIVRIRNKVYAHTDKSSDIGKLSLEELQSLVILANEIYHTIFGKIFDRHLDAERTVDWDLRYIMKVLKEHKYPNKK